MLPTQLFGRTGHESSRAIFGAAALGAMSQDRADATLELIGRDEVARRIEEELALARG